MKRLHFTFSAVLGDGLLVNDASILEKHVKTENWSYLQNRKSYKRLKKKNIKKRSRDVCTHRLYVTLRFCSMNWKLGD